jgi:peptidoglycan/LPS O-acetylase OafA/YrhL
MKGQDVSTIAGRWQKLSGKPSGFDYLRIALSVSVLLWHSYQVSYGESAALAFWNETRGTLLPIILPAFFALSGFLVSGSLFRNPDTKTFLLLRGIRIFPALSVEVILAAIVLGPILTSYTLARYFSDIRLYKYFLNIVGRIHYILPGVFENNPEQNIVNSQLWTIPFELECYIVIAICSIVGLIRNRRLLLVGFVGSSVGLAIWNSLHGDSAAPAGGVNGRVLVLCFLAGVVIYAYRDRIVLRARWASLCFVLTVVLFRVHLDQLQLPVYLCPLLVAYMTVYVGLLNPQRSIIINAGDFSYGVYLYSFPIQQAVASVFGVGGGWLQNVAISLPLVGGLALFSWWFIEKPFLKVRRYIGAKPSPTHSA